jgi:cytochrome b
VLAMILLLLTQTVLGLFAIDVDGIVGGPLDSLVSFDTAREMSALHGRVFNILLIIIGLHLAAVVFYLLYKRDNLVAAMIGGHKRVSAATEEQIRFVSLWWALPGVIAAGLLVLWIVFGHF